MVEVLDIERKRPSGRIIELDGLRGIAILAVMTYHYFQHFPQFYPYGDVMLPWSSHGYLGVQLFFLISGFVIAFTLARSSNPLRFIRHRFFRLWPPILVASAITFAVVHIVRTPFTLAVRTGVSGFLPSLTFVQPYVFKRFMHVDHYIDGAYWSLFVEIRFYFWAMLIRMFFSTRALVTWLTGAALVLTPLWHLVPNPAFHFYLDVLFFPSHLPLFAGGVIAYAAYSEPGGRRWLLPFAAMCVAEATMLLSWKDAVVVTGFFGIFACLVLRREWLGALKFAPLVWVGTISYSLYLLHQNVGAAMLTALPVGWPIGFYALAALPVYAAMFALAWLLFVMVERPAQRFARRVDKGSMAPASAAKGASGTDTVPSAGSRS